MTYVASLKLSHFIQALVPTLIAYPFYLRLYLLQILILTSWVSRSRILPLPSRWSTDAA